MGRNKYSISTINSTLLVFLFSWFYCTNFVLILVLPVQNIVVKLGGNAVLFIKMSRMFL